MSGYVCDDLMVDIFERLPPKSIIRFRSLSKYWHSRLVTPEFLHRHRLRCSKNPQKVLIRHLSYRKCLNHEHRYIYILHPVDQLPLEGGAGYVGVPGVEFDKLDFRLLLHSPALVGSCNGIVCLLRKEISLWNFTIRRKLIVPHHHHLKLYSQLALGFGYDPISDDYKIVSISYFISRLEETSTSCYSLRTDSWTDISLPSCIRIQYVLLLRACFYKGILHWVAYGYVTTKLTTKVSRYFILTFDLSSHVFGRILLPDQPKKIKQLTTINGLLALIYWDDADSWIWVMKEYGKVESWSQCYKAKSLEMSGVTGVLQTTTSGHILAYHSTSSVYNIQTRLFTKLMKFEPCCYKVDMDTYAESLELIDKESAETCGSIIFSWTN